MPYFFCLTFSEEKVSKKTLAAPRRGAEREKVLLLLFFQEKKSFKKRSDCSPQGRSNEQDYFF
jgi:hypothetical protein